MRPIKLTMTAYGPFANTEVVDFSKLGDNPLFLINGPTGSGKTTILDGICFALYGSTTGNEREASQMRCDHAGPDAIAKVELVFELRGTTYRIVREPEQQRPKLRGEGFTVHKPKAELYRIDEQGAESLMVAAKVLEATRAIEELTGLNVEQFRQVMVLPQGEFRRLLMADSREREKVFSQLFQTQIYKRIEDALKSQSSQLRHEREALRNQQKGILDSADLDDEDALKTELKCQEPLLTDAAKVKTAAAKKLNKTKEELLSAQQLQLQFESLATALNKFSALSSQTITMDAHRDELDRARVVIKLKPEHDQCKRETQKLKQANLRLKAAQLELSSSEDKLKKSDAVLEQAKSREPEIETARIQKMQLQAYIDRVQQLDSSRQTLQTCAADVERIQKVVKSHQLSLAESEKNLNKTKQQLADVTGRLKSLGAQQVELARLKEQLKRRQDLAKSEQELAECKGEQQLKAQALVQATEVLNNCERAAKGVEMAWHRGQATLLARELEEGEPCSVCGSEQHPNPATSEIEIPDQEQRDQERENVETARKNRATIENALSVLAAKEEQLLASAEVLQAELGESALQTLEKVKSMFTLQQQAVSALEAEQIKEQQLSELAEQLTANKEASRNKVAVSEKESVEIKTAMEVASHAVETAEAEIPEPYRAPGALDKAINEVSTTLLTLQQQLNNAQQKFDKVKLSLEAAKANLNNTDQLVKELSDSLAAVKTAWQQVLENSLFADEQEYQLAMRADDQIAALQQKIQNFDAEVAQAQGAIKTLQEALEKLTRPELEIIKQGLKKVDEEYQLAEKNHAEIDKRVSKLFDVENKLLDAKAAAKSIEDRYAVIGTLSDVANGKTGNRISLQRFVLSVLLDDVLVEASQRLKRMSKGRYELYRQQEKGKGGGASGLELMVEDAYNGKQRAVATLSGGESFMAALSLALGLSDVVQAYAGGIKLDTLFVDEGFGSLDPESLDLAVNTLIDLQASGRMVGIISHVPELKERINVRLDVHASRAGSTTQVISA